MNLFLYNSLTKKKSEFTPINESLVKMYVCGPTVYDRPHIGNARSVVVYDLLYRVLCTKYGKNSVKYVRNITDIDDKIINRAFEERVSISELTAKTTNDFHSDVEYLNCLPPTIEPKATEHLPEMFSIIRSLLEKGIAYSVENEVYFDVSCAKNYGKLSGRDITESVSGTRVEVDNRKRNPHDFVLWKGDESNSQIGANFSSEFGVGRPGWHIECSAMIHKHLGEDFDIHGGGIDLIFPHHTNEIAQSCSAFPGSGFARFWVHNGFLTVNKEKMSKSLGNFITVRDLIDQNLAGNVVRLFLLSAHYRKPLDYNQKALKDAKKMIDAWVRILNTYQDVLPAKSCDEFMLYLYDDLNVPSCIAFLNSLSSNINSLSYSSASDKSKTEAMVSQFKFALDILGFDFKGQVVMSEDTKSELTRLILERKEAKEKHDWQLADLLRNEITELGFSVEDNSDGTAKILDKAGRIALLV